jgi:protein-S-isoprenylcysteine O-methyltransferase Ste14
VLATLAATDYRLLGSGVESDCKKRAAFPFQLILFNYFLQYFFALLVSASVRTMWLTAESYRTKILIVRTDVSAVAKTLLFTVFVPGTVAGYVPWRLRQNAVPVAGAAEWASITVVAIGIAIYLHTAFWGFALIGGGTPAPVAPTKILVVKGLHRFVRNPMYLGVALVIGGQAWLFRSWHIAIYMVCMLLTAHLFVVFYEEPTLRKQFGEEYERYRASVPRWIPKVRS